MTPAVSSLANELAARDAAWIGDGREHDEER